MAKRRASKQGSVSSFLFDDAHQSKLIAGEYDKAYEALKPLVLHDSPEHIHLARAVARDRLQDILFCKSEADIGPLLKYAFSLAVKLSVTSLPGYATLDETHITDIHSVLTQIKAYIADRSLERPLNFLMMASPGSGKSHFINCIAKQCGTYAVAATTYNMATLASPVDLLGPLDEVRNAKVQDKFPLLFLDEFDSSPTNFALLLPLLWDGAVHVGQRDIRLGRLIVVMAGSSDVLPEVLKHASTMKDRIPLPEGATPKMIDLFSRINGAVIRIPPLDAQIPSDARPLDKTVIAIQLLRKRFGPQLSQVSAAFLRFVARLRFRYDVRSISHLIDLIPPRHQPTHLPYEDLTLPVKTVEQFRHSSLAYHIIDDVDNAHGVLKAWEEASRVRTLLPLDPPPLLPWSTEEDLKLSIAYGLHSMTVSKSN